MGSGFDGVLSDSWSARRRASEGLLKGNDRPGEPGDPHEGTKTVGIKEEDEEGGASRLEPAASNGGVSGSQTDQPSQDSVVNGAGHVQTTLRTISGGMNNLSLEPGSHNSPQIPPTATNVPPGPPPGLSDPATMEWTYLDPQGQVQGKCVSCMRLRSLKPPLRRSFPRSYNAKVV